MEHIPPADPKAAANFDPGRDPFTTTLIRRKVAWLVSVPPFTHADRDDLYQEAYSLQ